MRQRREHGVLGLDHREVVELEREVHGPKSPPAARVRACTRVCVCVRVCVPRRLGEPVHVECEELEHEVVAVEPVRRL